MQYADFFTKAFVSIDEESGELNNTETTQRLDPLHMQLTPSGCCDILSNVALQTKSVMQL